MAIDVKFAFDSADLFSLATGAMQGKVLHSLADLNNDGTINFSDLGVLKAVFFSNDADADLVGPGNTDPDGTVNFFDLGRMKEVFFAPPGPSAAGCN